jgi:hypothetical protein
VRTYRLNLSTVHSLSLWNRFDCNPDKDEGGQRDEQDKDRERADHHRVPPNVLGSRRPAFDRTEAKPTLLYHREYPYLVSKL